MTPLPPQFELSPSPDFETEPTPRRRLLPARVLLAVILLLLIMVLLALIPSLRARTITPFFNQLSGGSISETNTSGRVADVAGAPLSASITSTTTISTPRPTLDLDVAVVDAPGEMRWQIAYAGDERGPGSGCGYLSFWLTGADAERFDLLEKAEAHLTVYDGDFIFERYGPSPLSALRSRGEPRYYELPAGDPDCRRHRLAEAADYAGMAFVLTLQANEMPIHSYRGVLLPETLVFATATPTPPPAGPTPTPFPQVRVSGITNVRSGPGTLYPALGSTTAGATYAVVASNADRSWWQIDFSGQPGWIFASLTEATAVEGIAVAAVIPPAPVPLPTATPIPPRLCPRLRPRLICLSCFLTTELASLTLP